MKIIVIIPNNGKHEIETQPSDTILDFKKKIFNHFHIQPDSETIKNVHIIYQKKYCKDQQTLISLQIVNNARILLNLSNDLIKKIYVANINEHSFQSPSASKFDNDLNFSFPQIATNQEINIPNQEQNTYTTGVPSSNPIIVPQADYFPPTPMSYVNMDQSKFENNVNLLVSLGYKERSARNALKLTGNIFFVAENALKKGLFQDEESNKLAESLETTSSPEKRQEILSMLLRDLVNKCYTNMSSEDKEFQYQNFRKTMSSYQNYAKQGGFSDENQYFQGHPAMQMIQQSKLSPNENEILPLLKNALNGIGGFSNNPFAAYLETKDDSAFFDLNGSPSEELFDKFLQASTLETEQWKFVAKCMLQNIPLNEGLYYLECADYDPVTAASFIKD